MKFKVPNPSAILGYAIILGSVGIGLLRDDTPTKHWIIVIFKFFGLAFVIAGGAFLAVCGGMFIGSGTALWMLFVWIGSWLEFYGGLGTSLALGSSTVTAILIGVGMAMATFLPFLVKRKK